MIFQLGWRNIWRNKRRTSTILTAIIIGVWAMIFLAALMRGVAERMVLNSISTLTGHIQIQNKDFRKDPAINNFIQLPENLEPALKKLPPTAQWTSRVRVAAVANNARHSSGVMLVGINPEQEAKISFIGSAVKKGRYLEDQEHFGIVIGQALLEKFETRIGHKLVLMSQASDNEIASRAFRIVGVFRSELQATEKQFVFVTLPAAQRMLKLKNEISEVSICLENYKDADNAAAVLRANLSDDSLKVYTWKTLLPMMTALLKMYDGFIFLWFVVVFIAMGFGLVNTILMAVFERVREFGLFRAMGMKSGQVVSEVLAESFFLLAIGTFAGDILSILSVYALSGSGIDLSAFAAGMEFVGMPRVIIPILYVKDIVVADVTVFVLGLLISLYPAVKAARFSPVEAMVYN